MLKDIPEEVYQAITLGIIDTRELRLGTVYLQTCEAQRRRIELYDAYKRLKRGYNITMKELCQIISEDVGNIAPATVQKQIYLFMRGANPYNYQLEKTKKILENKV